MIMEVMRARPLLGYRVDFAIVMRWEEWQLLTGFEAINGLIMFGISAAFLFAVFGMLYRKMTRDKYTPMW